MRKLEIYVRKYGPDGGPRLFHLLQSQAAHAGVSARLKTKIATLSEVPKEEYPLFPTREPTGIEMPSVSERIAFGLTYEEAAAI